MEQVYEKVKELTPELESYYHEAVRLLLRLDERGSPHAEFVVYEMMTDSFPKAENIQTLLAAMLVAAGESVESDMLPLIREARPDLLAQIPIVHV